MEKINIEHLNIPEGSKPGTYEIVIRSGDAPKNIDPIHLVQHVGQIHTPKRLWITRYSGHKRWADAVLIVGKQFLKLVINQHQPLDQVEITGMLVKNQVLENLSNSRDSKDLIKYLRKLLPYFVDRADFKKLSNAVSNYRATLERQLNVADDQRGNVIKQYEQKMVSDTPSTFHVEIPLYEGTPPTRIELEIIPEIRNEKLYFTLDCLELDLLLDQAAEQIIKQEIEAIDLPTYWQ